MKELSIEEIRARIRAKCSECRIAIWRERQTECQNQTCPLWDVGEAPTEARPAGVHFAPPWERLVGR